MHFFKAGKGIFADEDLFLNAIQKGDTKAILYLQDKATGFTHQFMEQKRLPRHLFSEVLNDASIILLKKVREPGFALQSAKVSTYFVEIVKKVALNKTRNRQFSGSDSIETQQHLSDTSVEEYYARKEHIELINNLLKDISMPCSDIIRLKYLDGYSDEEVIKQQLSLYSSVESLRVKRSDCMKKLRDLARKHM